MSEKGLPEAGPSHRSSHESDLELVDRFLADEEAGNLHESQATAQDTSAGSANGSHDSHKLTANETGYPAKARAVLLFLVVNCAYDLLLYHLKVRNPSSLVLFLPGQAVVVLIAAVLVRLLGERGRVQTLSAQLGNNFTLLPSSTWLQFAALAGFTVVSSTAYVHQAFWTETVVGQSVFVSGYGTVNDPV
jgi:hypothetical protein